jgi:NADH-quinone oxidoreductase subunit L
MTVPLIILATLSICAGWLNPGFHVWKEAPLEHWLKPVFVGVTEKAVKIKEGGEHMEYQLAVGGVLAFLIGTAVAYWMYVQKKGEPAKRAAEAAPGLYKLVLDKWLIDELYDATVVAAVESLAETSAAFDRFFVDGIIARLTSLVVAAAGTVLRAFQNGVVHVYAGLMVAGLAVMGWFFAVPHPSATISDAGNDDYVVTAAPGLGYQYRWDADGNGKPDSEGFGDQGSVKVHVEAGKSQTVTLEVRNSFGLTRSAAIKVARPEKTQTLEVGQN